MGIPRISAAFFLLTAVAVSCTDQPVPTASSDLPTAGPSFNFTNGPEEAGIVVRFETDTAFLFVDFDRQILSLHSSDDGLRGCTAATAFEPLDVQQVFGGNGRVARLRLAQKNFVTVYDWTGFPPINCPLLTNATGLLLAEGSSQLEEFDNDIEGGAGFPPFEEGANAFGFNSAGELTNVATGSSIGYRLHRTHLILPDGTLRINLVRQGPLLNPDPR